MYFLTPDTIVQANQNIKALDSKMGGLLCVLHCLTEDIEENVSYTIDGEKLRKQLSVVFDKEPRESFDNAKPSYIIFAKDWVSNFFHNYIKNRVDLLSCAVFFLRRYGFEKECTKEEVIDIFIKRFNLKNIKGLWFCDSENLELNYNQSAVEDNQSEFYNKMGYSSDFKSILFSDVIKKSAADLKAAGQIQTLYSGSGVHECFLLSNEPLEKYYIMSNSSSKNIINNDEDVFHHNVYGIHIKEENTALSEDNPHICIGWSDMGDLSDITTKEELGNRYDKTWPDVNKRKKGQDVGQVWRFLNNMQVGDYVVFADGDVCHIGKITSGYYHNGDIDSQSPDYANTRNVEWLKKDILRSDLSESFHHSLMTAMSVWGLNDYKSAVYDLLNGTYMKDEIITEEDIAVIVEDTKTNYTIDELGAILTKMYNGSGNKTTAIHMFGFKYGEVIEKNGYAATKIISASEVPDSYHVEVNKGTAMYRSVKENEYGVTFAKKQDLNTEVFNYFSTKGEAINKIFYGTPGCGKSFHIEHNILGKSKESKQYDGDYKKENIIRTTFYQDYSNTDFVGQILPKVVKGENGEKDTVEYIFNPGPFTLTLIRAISNPDKKVALVVEEINRGNAPAIFGDVFQLLDRDSDGISEYGIKNVGVLDYLNDYTFEVDGEKKKYIFDEIKIPGNMYIYATMNTSDQNVYTLDTAFVRRWDKEKIKNSFNGCSFAATKVPGIEYTWQEFVDSINKHIAKHLEDLQVNEDKQIGAFFVKESLLKANDPEKFAYKVFDYLWSDVAKLDHGIFFNHFDTLEALIEAYAKTGVSVFKTGIFDKKETPQIVEDDENNE